MPTTDHPDTRPTIADALRTVAVAKAVTELARERQKEAESYAADLLYGLKETMGADPRLAVADWGTALITQPTYTAHVDDAEAFAKWVEDGQHGTVVRRQVVDGAALQADVDRADPVVLAFLAEHGYLREDIVLTQVLLDEVLKLPRDGDGYLIDATTGEALPVKAVAKSTPSARITVDAVAVERVKAQITKRVPELAAPPKGDA